MIIGLAGKFGAGKDAVADVLVERFGFRKLSFAEPLRQECAEAIETRQYPDVIPDYLRENLKCLEPKQVWEKPTKPSTRELLQLWGTNFRRAADPDYWVRKTAEEILRSPDANIVLSDVRFPNEAAVAKFHGRLWLINRPSQQLTAHHAHESERFCSEYTDWDLVVQNDSDLTALQDKVAALYRCELELSRIAQERITTTSPTHRFGLDLGECDWQAEKRTIQLQ